MSPEARQRHFEALIDDASDAETRESAITALRSDEDGRRLLEIWRWMESAEDPVAEVDLWPALRERLPISAEPSAASPSAWQRFGDRLAGLLTSRSLATALGLFLILLAGLSYPTNPVSGRPDLSGAAAGSILWLPIFELLAGLALVAYGLGLGRE